MVWSRYGDINQDDTVRQWRTVEGRFDRQPRNVHWDMDAQEEFFRIWLPDTFKWQIRGGWAGDHARGRWRNYVRKEFVWPLVQMDRWRLVAVIQPERPETHRAFAHGGQGRRCYAN